MVYDSSLFCSLEQSRTKTHVDSELKKRPLFLYNFCTTQIQFSGKTAQILVEVQGLSMFVKGQRAHYDDFNDPELFEIQIDKTISF